MNLRPFEWVGMLILYQLVPAQKLSCQLFCMSCFLKTVVICKCILCKSRWLVLIHEISIQPKNPSIILVFQLVRHRPHLNKIRLFLWCYQLNSTSSVIQYGIEIGDCNTIEILDLWQEYRDIQLLDGNGEVRQEAVDKYSSDLLQKVYLAMFVQCKSVL